jgi:AraC-like DNA-binding protein
MDEGLLTNLKYVVRSILGVYLLIPLYLIVNPKLTHNFEIVYSKLENEKNNQQLDISIIGMKKEQNSNMDEPENEKYIQLSHEIMEYLKVNKPFLRPDFKAHDICTELNIPRHHVQYIINQILKTNFADLKNKLRIEYALDLLKDNTTKNMSLEGIGQKSGFTSNSNFYKIFKDVTGLTPSQWAKENGNNKV